MTERDDQGFEGEAWTSSTVWMGMEGEEGRDQR